jgi:hypothetical protein
MTLSRSLALVAAATVAAFAAAAPASAQTVVCKNGLPDWAARAYSAGGRQGGFHCEPAGVVQTGRHGWSGGGYAALRAQQLQQQKIAEAKRLQAVAAAKAEGAARQQAAIRAAAQQQAAKVAAQDPAESSVSVAKETTKEVVAEAKPSVRKEPESKTAAAKSDCRRFIPSLGTTVEVPCGQ